MPIICAEFGIRASATRRQRARARRKRRGVFSCRENAAVSTVRTNDERRASCATKDFAQKERARRRRRKRETVVDALVSRETRLSCTVCEKAFPSKWRSPPSVARVLTSRRAAERGERRDREPRDVPSWRSRVVASGTSRAGRLDVVRASRHRSRAAPRHRASLRVGVGRDALSSAREQTRRRAVRANQARARWMTHLVPRGPVPRAPLHHLQLVLDQSELLRTGRAFAGAGRG